MFYESFNLSAVTIGVRVSLATLLTVSASYVYAETVQKLPTITVQAEQDNKTYTEKSTASATKLNLDLKDTPQSVTFFTKQQMEDQLLTSASDVLMNTAGVTAIQYGQEGAGYSTYYSRGFEIKNILRDGIPSSYAAFGGKDMMGLEGTAIYERIEVLKGSTGLTSGSGYPSASIIYVRKRPTEELTGPIKVLGGTWDNYRSQVDVSGGLNADDSVRGRSVALYEQGGSQQDHYHRQNAVFYGALDVDLTDKTTLTSAITIQQVELDDGRLNASAAYFQMQQDNLGVDTGADQADGTSIYESIDGAEVKGYELSLAGEILPKWNIQAGYTHTDAKDANGDVLNTYIPEDTFKLFTSYQWDKLTIGGGVNWQSEFYLDGVTGIEAEAGRQDDYYLVNLMAKYDIQPDLTLGVNVKKFN